MKKVLAFDIGGTNTRLALINEKFEVEKRMDYPTVTGSVDGFINNCIKLIEQFPLEDVVAIGAGVPGVVNRETGYIYFLPNCGINDIPFGERIKERFGLPVFIRNDAEVACLGEAYLGAGKKEERVFFITISTGLGGALCVNKINQDYITEIGHTLFNYKGQMTIYEITSGKNIPELARRNGIDYITSSRTFFEKIREKDPGALLLYEEWISILNKFIKLIVDSYNPDIICMTGGVMKSKDVFFSRLKKENKGVKIVECKFSESAGIMGAAVYGLQCAKII